MRTAKEVTYSLYLSDHKVPAKQLFAKEVVTRLPYAVSTRMGMFRYSGFMIDEERLIGMKVRFTSSYRF